MRRHMTTAIEMRNSFLNDSAKYLVHCGRKLTSIKICGQAGDLFTLLVVPSLYTGQSAYISVSDCLKVVK